MPNAAENFKLRLLSPEDKTSGLSFGHADFIPLKTYLKKHAVRYQQCSMAKTYLLVTQTPPEKLVGYITLVCGQVQMKPPVDVGDYPYPDIPAIKIARLAIVKEFQRMGLGGSLVDFAIATTKNQIMPHVGCRFLILDSKQQSIAFYKSKGFFIVDTESNKAEDHPVMFIDLGKLND